MVQPAVHNPIAFRYVLNNVWFASAENMRFIKVEVAQAFIMPLKRNRKIALRLADKKPGRYVQLGSLDLKPHTVREVYLEGVEFPLLLVKHVFVNEDGSAGVVYLLTSDTSLMWDNITTIYRTRWNVEPYHKSLKQNAALERSPTHTVTTQTHHFCAALEGYIKLERLKVKTKLNHFALKARLYTQARRRAFDTLQELRAAPQA